VYIRVDLSQVPPVTEVGEQEDFKGFRVVVALPSHAWVHPDALVDLAGRADDAAWREDVAGMAAFAGSRGWLDEHGRLRAHVEIEKL
jgi:hypothetical protein